MKKIRIFLMLTMIVSVLFFTGCGNAETGNTITDKTTIVCTNFPLYDWARTLLADSDAEVILLLDNGTDMHSFQPSAEALIQIAECDVLVHVGGESDLWLEDALEANPNENRIVVNLMDVLGDELKEETYVEGMQTEHVHEDGTVHTGEACENEVHHNEGESEPQAVAMDEHIWLSLRMAISCCEAMEEAFCKILPDDEALIRQNGEAYRSELTALDVKYMTMMEEAEGDTIIVADRFPFLYLAEDYNIQYYAAFPGCSTESEADFETVVFLAEKVTEYDTNILLITESGTDTLANTVMDNSSGQEREIRVLHSMQVVYNSDIENGCSYIGYMEENLNTLQQALN